MYDGLQLFIRNTVTFNRLRFMTGAVEQTSMDTGEVLSRCWEYGVFNIKLLFGKIPDAQINGSLHRFYCDGHNDSLLTFRQVRKAVEKFAWTFCIDLRQPCLQRLEFGVNIYAKSPEAFIDAALLYHGQGPTKIQRHKRDYYKYWEFTDYTVKLYKKGASLLRFEIHVKRLRWLNDARICSLEDMRHKNVFVKLLHRLIMCADEFLFVPTRNDAMPEDIREKWASLRDLSNWLSLKPYQKTRQKQWVQHTIDQYSLVDWTSYLKKNIRQIGSRMLETDETTFAAMFSTLGLHAQTVAGPQRDCDRQAEDVTIMFWKNLVPGRQVVRNTWSTVSVTISAPSYSLAYPRGPPSVLSFLLFMYEYRVALLIPVASRMSLIGMVPVSYRARALLIALAFALGRPPSRPRALAAARPSIVRSWVRSRSNWLTPAKIVKSNFPWGVVVSSHASFSDLMFAPAPLIRSTSSKRSLVDRLSRVSSQMTTVSPERRASSSFPSSGRSFFVPETFSW